MNVAFPFRVGAGGRTVDAERPAYLRQLIELTLLTEPGERVGRPEFGCGLQELLFSAEGSHAAAATAALVQGALQHALSDVVSIHSVDLRVEDATVWVDVAFVDRRTGRADTVRLERR